ncbi:MAG TPA: sensor domain-containing diguanylate cyclase [Cellulomonas sp.]|uniref:GGDEF domain-containing protein n=1 Tax=Cellulomonas sp. TaxID=40001 RepID=UPI002E352D46|nr:sensor domain-containing diguanylate cyclase [Cellulomonas sp.]HEX5333586.1 sensor domain-containing diguanylate cyclase [Cellulomonas sp.]
MIQRDELTTVRGATTLRPLSDPGALRRGAPFVAVALVAVLLELSTVTESASRLVLVAAGVSMLLVPLAAVIVPWGRLPAWCEAALPIGFFVVVALMRQARGGAAVGYTPLVMLPIIWLALYGSRRQLALAVAAMAVILMGPMILIGPPLYPASAWTTTVVSVVVAMFAGPPMQMLVEQSRQRTVDVAALGAITRSLTAGSDPRPDLCAAARLVTGARFAVIFERSPDGELVATAGTPGLDLEQMRIDSRTETSATAEAWRRGTRIYLADAARDPRASARLTELTGAVAVLFEPVTRDGCRSAVLVVGFSRSRARVPEHALYMVELVAAEIAAALDRADLVALLAAQARTDALTGAANRRSWDEELDRELARARRTGEPLTIALVDMDRFKAYNDTYGHTAGDELLRGLVTALHGELRTGDIVARWGGEEFALALPACDLDHAAVIASRLLRVVPGAQTISIGLTQAGLEDSPRTLIGRADRALYAAKDRGRNQISTLPAPSSAPASSPGPTNPREPRDAAAPQRAAGPDARLTDDVPSLG